MSKLGLLRIGKVIEDDRFSWQSDSFSAAVVGKTEMVGVLTLVLHTEVISFTSARESRLTIASNL